MHFYQQVDGVIYRHSFDDAEYKELITGTFPVSKANLIVEILNAEYARGRFDGRYEVKGEIREALGI